MTRKPVPQNPTVDFDKSWHLARDAEEISLTELEFAILRFVSAFNRFNEVGIRTASGHVLSANEIVLLNVIRMQDRPKSAAVLGTLMNRDDHSNIQYSLRKLRDLKLIRLKPGSKKKSYEYLVTPEGTAATENFAELKRQVLGPMIRSMALPGKKIDATTDLVHILTGVFDEGTRVTATYGRGAAKGATPAETGREKGATPAPRRRTGAPRRKATTRGRA
ncbi:MAG: winged helix DNA-binding protein [Alphaproteobacteria bacterium]